MKRLARSRAPFGNLQIEWTIVCLFRASAGDDVDPVRPSIVLAGLAQKLNIRGGAGGNAGGDVAVGDVVRHLGGDASAGWLLLLLAVPALVPSPGVPLGMVFGAALALLALQLTFGPRPLHLPAWIARRRLAARHLDATTARVGPWIERIEKTIRPRLAALTSPWVVRLLGLVVLVNAILIILPIPLGNTLPAIAVMSLALGLIARDGYAVAAGFALSVLALAASAALVGGAVWLAETLMRQ